ncbi:MAG: hypothetical protein KKC68_06980 [Candidatus Thermoplasmatota archaeon]|nr:hypothetical protein [Candidatus Thermoplasmatota archaeon]MBU1941503.1 hypothetical protein [Candidatus Thermoplasmatota archaeon]
MRANVVDGDPAWVSEIVSFVSDKDNEHIFLKNKELLRDLYLEYMRDGMNPKDALLKAKNVILSFDNK